ncbi:RNA polymerase I-specific transcription initiation factor RRN3-domain-containing protein [Obelidium mucronatum]|nr:RNA polymerase I-specific transcription initiation factor RRN3-domain-containing protein [Obelidium mucronatum]
MWYLKNTMRIVTYAPVLQNCVWLLAIDKIVQIDVEIQTSLDDLDEEEYDSVLQHCFDFDGADLDSPDLLASPNTFVGAGKAASLGSNNNVDIDVDFELSMDALYDSDRESDAGSSTSSESDSEDEEDSDDEDGGPPPLIISDFREMAGKLDSLLQYLMHQISAVHETASSTKDELFLESFFQMLLLGFERTVLPTHKCRYAQFLFFKACSLSPKWCEAFLVFLAQKSFDAGTPSIIRVAAISYLSSFISRAAFLDTPSLLQCLRLLTAWALQYVEANETAKTYPDLKKDHVFYSVVQAILYIFCFRWQEIVGATQGQLHGQLPVEMTGFQKIVMSKFAPLQICARSIVTEFARITHKLDILYCYNLMNKKSSASAATAPATSTKPSATATTSTASISDSVSKDEPPQEQCYFITTETLDAFFPFDPCNLPMSRKAIQAKCEDNELHQPGSDLHAQRLLSQIGSFGSDISDALSASLDHILSFASPPRGIY